MFVEKDDKKINLNNATILSVHDEDDNPNSISELFESEEGYGKFMVVEINDEITDFFIQNDSKEYSNFIAVETDFPRVVLYAIIEYITAFDNNKELPFDDPKINFIQRADFGMKEYLIDITDYENPELRKIIDEDTYISIHIVME